MTAISIQIVAAAKRVKNPTARKAAAKDSLKTAAQARSSGKGREDRAPRSTRR
jgi:hypothetical protein